MIREVTGNDLDGLLRLYMQLHDNPMPDRTSDLFPRAMSQADALAHPFGECREGQYPAACFASNFMPRQLAAGLLTADMG